VDDAASKKQAEFLQSQLDTHPLTQPPTKGLTPQLSMSHPPTSFSIAGIHPPHPLPGRRRSGARRSAQPLGQVPSRCPAQRVVHPPQLLHRCRRARACQQQPPLPLQSAHLVGRRGASHRLGLISVRPQSLVNSIGIHSLGFLNLATTARVGVRQLQRLRRRMRTTTLR
jgi:hypothetical protein